MRKISAILLLAFITASCAGSRCGCPNNLGMAPDTDEPADRAVAITDAPRPDTGLVWY